MWSTARHSVQKVRAPVERSPILVAASKPGLRAFQRTEGSAADEKPGHNQEKKVRPGSGPVGCSVWHKRADPWCVNPMS